jgi:hypothetical protein
MACVGGRGGVVRGRQAVEANNLVVVQGTTTLPLFKGRLHAGS